MSELRMADGTCETMLHLLRHGEIEVVVGPLWGALAAADVDEQTLLEGHIRASTLRPATSENWAEEVRVGNVKAPGVFHPDIEQVASPFQFLSNT